MDSNRERVFGYWISKHQLTLLSYLISYCSLIFSLHLSFNLVTSDNLQLNTCTHRTISSYCPLTVFRGKAGFRGIYIRAVIHDVGGDVILHQMKDRFKRINLLYKVKHEMDFLMIAVFISK